MFGVPTNSASPKGAIHGPTIAISTSSSTSASPMRVRHMRNEARQTPGSFASSCSGSSVTRGTSMLTGASFAAAA